MSGIEVLPVIRKYISNDIMLSGVHPIAYIVPQKN